MLARNRWGFGLFTLLAVLVSTACGHGDDVENPLYANGRIEGDEVKLAAEISGRVSRLNFAEGERVRSGQVVVELDNTELEARLRQARSGVAAAQATVVQAETRVRVLEHHVATAGTDLERMQALRDAGAASARQVDEAEGALEEVSGELEVARSRVAEAEARLEERRAAVDAVEASRGERYVTAPSDGVILYRLAEVGEVVQAGQPLAILIDLEALHLKVYVAQREIGRVRSGNPVTVTADALSDRSFEGFVLQVADQAEYTPRDVHMPDERTRLVYAVKIRCENPEGLLKPGMTADAWIHWRESAGRRDGE